MNSFERVKRAIYFKKPDRCPIWYGSFNEAALIKYGEKLNKILSKHSAILGSNEREFREIQHYVYDFSQDIKTKFIINEDFYYINPRSFSFGPIGQIGMNSDEWNVVWEKAQSGYMGYIKKHPLSNWKDWENYKFPNALDYWRWDLEGIKESIYKARNIKKYIISWGGALFDKMWWLRSMENLFIDMVSNKNRIHKLANELMKYLIETVERLGDLGVDGVLLTDDWGTQNGLQISPEMWREMFKPYYKEIFIKAHNKKLDVHFHSCGNILDIIPDLIEIGVDVLNPQFSAMDLNQLSKLVKNKICIRTDIDRQYMLVKASKDEMIEYVKNICQKIGSPEGGLIECAYIEETASLENIETMYYAFEKYGKLK